MQFSCTTCRSFRISLLTSDLFVILSYDPWHSHKLFCLRFRCVTIHIIFTLKAAFPYSLLSLSLCLSLSLSTYPELINADTIRQVKALFLWPCSAFPVCAAFNRVCIFTWKTATQINCFSKLFKLHPFSLNFIHSYDHFTYVNKRLGFH